MMAESNGSMPDVSEGLSKLSEEKGNVSSLEDEDGDLVDSMPSTRRGKPPRRLSMMPHCNSSAWLNESDVVGGMMGFRSPMTDKSGEFLPVFRSGSCSEKGPKQYMEDEHICVDNLHENIRSSIRWTQWYRRSIFYQDKPP